MSDPKTNLIKPVKHMPFEKKMCPVCHNKPDSADPFGLVKPQKEVCGGCHPESQILPDAQGTKHPPVVEGYCTRCHSPHASASGTKLIHGDLDENCFLCHSKIGDATVAEHKHAALKDGNCLKCHKPHSSPNERLLVKSTNTLCQGCHVSQAKHTHPVGDKYTNPATGKPMTCASCHDVHGSHFSYITKADRDRDLCMMCHKVAM